MLSSAKSAVRDAISFGSNDPECYKLLGDIYSQEGNCREAVYQYQRALNQKKNYSEAYFGMALCYNKLGQINDEIEAYKKAIEYNDTMAAAMLESG